jgi:hypothetical protein
MPAAELALVVRKNSSVINKIQKGQGFCGSFALHRKPVFSVPIQRFIR